MKTTALNNTNLKEVAIIVLCLLLGFVGIANAGGEEAKAKKAMVKAEIELLKELEASLEKDLDKINIDLLGETPQFQRVEVYSMAGELLSATDLNGKEFNEQMVLPHAHLLTIDGYVAVYVVF